MQIQSVLERMPLVYAYAISVSFPKEREDGELAQLNAI